MQNSLKAVKNFTDNPHAESGISRLNDHLISFTLMAGFQGNVLPGTAPFDLVVVAVSAEGIQGLHTLLAGLPGDFPVPVAIVQARDTLVPNFLPHLLNRITSLKVKLARENEVLEAGTVYIAPPDLHMSVDPGGFPHLRDGRRLRHVLSPGTPLFESAARVLKDRVIAVVLTTPDSDIAEGVEAVHDFGGVVITQDQPASDGIGRVLPLNEIAPALIELASKKPAPAGSAR